MMPLVYGDTDRWVRSQISTDYGSDWDLRNKDVCSVRLGENNVI